MYEAPNRYPPSITNQSSTGREKFGGDKAENKKTLSKLFFVVYFDQNFNM